MGGKVRVLKDVGGGLRGSTSGLRFNPREAPEFAEEDRNLGRDDPEGRQQFEEKRRREKEERHKKIAGLHHINLKIPKKKRAKGDNARNDEELSEMTGPASSTGYPVDIASGAKTGGGSAMGGPNIMTGEVIVLPSDILLKRDIARTNPGIKSIENHLRKERHRNSRKTEKQMGGNVFRARHKVRKQLNAFGSRNQKRQSTIRNGVSKRTQVTKGMPRTNTLTNSRQTRGLKTGGNTLWMQNNPMVRMARAMKSGLSKGAATFMPYGIPYAFGAGRSLGKGSNNTFQSLKKMYKRNPVLHPVPLIRAPRQSSIPGGQAKTPPLVKPFSGVGDSILNPSLAMNLSMDTYDYEYLLEDIMLKKMPSLSHADLAEFKQLVRDLRRMMRSGSFKKAGLEDVEHDGERPTPNAHRRTTSSPTGATETDPDDDPRFWGAHPMGLLLPRRGHM